MFLFIKGLEYIITFCPYGWGGAACAPTVEVDSVSNVYYYKQKSTV